MTKEYGVSIRTIALTLRPTPEQETLLSDLQAAFNDACNCASAVAWERREFRRLALQELVYRDLRKRRRVAPGRGERSERSASPAGRRALSVNSTIRELLADDDARAVLERHLPGFAGTAPMGMAAGLSLIQVAAFAPEQITQERLAAIAADLATP
jgi:hypothetical protein